MTEDTQRHSSEQSFWTRINPFHPRPPSILKRASQFEPDNRPQSSLERATVEEGDIAERYSTVYTPVASESPTKPSRTPSILRTIAHRSSFSALKSRSKRKKGPKVRPPLPALDLQQPLVNPGIHTLPDQTLDSHTVEDKESDWGPVRRGETPSKRKLRKGSLKAVKSVPRDLNLSQNGPDDHVFSDHPLPFKTTSPIVKPIKARTPRSKRSGSTPSRKTNSTPGRSSAKSNGIDDVDITPTKPSGKGAKRPSGPHPDISIDVAEQRFGSPDSLRVRRMYFEFDVELDNVTVRKRAASHSEIQAGSPKKILPQPTSPRHMSSPPSPMKYGSVTRTIPTHAPYRHPFTSQHPHPVPLSPLESFSFADSTTFHHDFLPAPTEFFSLSTRSTRRSKSSPPKAERNWEYDDFVPLTQSGRTMDLEDGLDLLVRDEDLPTGTPGGRRADLRSGALIDGAPHERGAVRFFSRDMYGGRTPSPSPSPAPSPQQHKQGRRNDTTSGDLDQVAAESGDDCRDPTPSTDSLRPRHNRRSSSPFEVKLTPIVTKRMSLDAFGTPEPVTVSDSGHGDPPIEETEELIDEGEEVVPEQADTVALPPTVHFRHTSLSTIRETPSSKGSEANTSLPHPGPAATPSMIPRAPGSGLKTGQTGRAEFFTPLSLGEITGVEDSFIGTAEDSFIGAFSDRSTVSPSVRRDKYRSAPVLPVTRPSSTWTPVQDQPSPTGKLRELEMELRAREAVLSQLEEELRILKSGGAESKERASWDTAAQRQQEIRNLQEMLEDRDEELEQMLRQAADRVKSYEKALEDQRTAMEENEEFCETLQTAHDDLATRLVELEAQHSELCLERHKDAITLVTLQDERDRLQASVDKHRRTDDRAQEAISELQMSIVKAEEALESANTSYSTRQAELEDQINHLQALLDAKTARVDEVEDMLKGGLEREQELGKLRTRIQARDVQLRRLEHVLDETREEVDNLRKESEERGIKVARLENRVREVEEDEEVARRDLKAALRQNNAKDSIIGVLRDKLGSAAYAADEVRATHGIQVEKLREEIGRLEGQAKELQEQVEEMSRAAEVSNGEIGRLNGVLSEHDCAKDDQIRGLESKVEMLGQALRTLREEKEAIEAKAREREVAWKEAVDTLAKLEVERKEWLVEKPSLAHSAQLSQVTQTQLDSTQLQLEEAHHDLALAQDDAESLNDQLEQLYSTSAAQQLMLTARDAEIVQLRNQLLDAEDSAASGTNASLRKSRDAENLIEELRSTIDELHVELERRDAALRSAVFGVEMEKASGADVKSRLEAYLGEIDRLSMSEAGLKKQLEDARRRSADQEMRFEALYKRVAGLEEDKELLNVALDSKQTELVLLQRQVGSRPGGGGGGLAGSIGRRPKSVAETSARQHLFASTSSATSASRTLSRRPSSVMSTNEKRDSWIPPTPTTRVPTTPKKASPRKAQSTPTTAKAKKLVPLGASRKHNKTPEKSARVGEKKAGAGRAGGAELTRQTSLPVLRGNKAGELGRSVSSRPPSVIE